MVGNPFRLSPNAETASLDVELGVGIGGWGFSIGKQKWKGPVLAAEGWAAAAGCVGNGAGLVEPIDLHVGATAQSDIGNHAALLR